MSGYSRQIQAAKTDITALFVVISVIKVVNILLHYIYCSTIAASKDQDEPIFTNCLAQVHLVICWI